MSAHETLDALPLGAWVVVTTPQGEAWRCQRVASGVYVEGDLTIAVEDVDPDATVLLLDGDDPFDEEDYADRAARWELGPSVEVGAPAESPTEGASPEG